VQSAQLSGISLSASKKFYTCSRLIGNIVALPIPNNKRINMRGPRDYPQTD
jgi:hypothetical protein